MNRKIVALLLAVMLVASSVAAFAVAPDKIGFEAGHFTKAQELVDAANAEIETKVEAKPWEYTTGKYSISDDGIWMTIAYTTYKVPANFAPVYNDKGEIKNNPHHATKAADYCAAYMEKVDNQKVITLNYTAAQEADDEALLKVDHVVKVVWKLDGNRRLVLMDDGSYKLFTLTGEYNKGNIAGDASALPTTGADSFTHYYTNYANPALVNSVTFDPKSFGDGVTFNHTATKLFNINVKYDCTALIQIRDEDGRLYPVNGGKWNAAENRYELTLTAGDNTISWFGADGTGWHKEGSAASKATTKLDVNMTIATVAKDLAGKSFETDKIDIRFDYVARHGKAAHAVAADNTASAPKTGDAGMAYMTLAALIVMMGAAVVVTRKVRNF